MPPAIPKEIYFFVTAEIFTQRPREKIQNYRLDWLGSWKLLSTYLMQFSHLIRIQKKIVFDETFRYQEKYHLEDLYHDNVY